jgi:hypothetical protein
MPRAEMVLLCGLKTERIVNQGAVDSDELLLRQIHAMPFWSLSMLTSTGEPVSGRAMCY